MASPPTSALDCPVPVWLDPSREVTASHDPETRAEWVRRTGDLILAAGAPVVSVFGLLAHFGTETRDGQRYRANNFGGVKASQSWALSYQRRTGGTPEWYRALGHVASGDAPCVYYRGYPSRQAFIGSWLRSYVPRPADGTPEPAAATERPNYRRTGWLFWRGDPGWFPELLEQGYRGEVTRATPAPSIATWEGKRASMRAMWVQDWLGTPASGTWTDRDRTAALALQKRAGIPETGEPDDATVRALFALPRPGAAAAAVIVGVGVTAALVLWWRSRSQKRRRRT